MFLLCRQIDTQTKGDNYSNISKPQVFLEGLRGGGMEMPTAFNKVDLTVDVSEPPIVTQFIARKNKEE